MFVFRDSHLFTHKTIFIAYSFTQPKSGIQTYKPNYRSRINESEQIVSKRRVVVTGVGVVSPIGCNTTAAWNGILNGSCGIKSLHCQQYETLPCKIAAKVNEEDLKLTEHFSKSELRSLAKTTVYALIAGSIYSSVDIH